MANVLKRRRSGPSPDQDDSTGSAATNMRARIKAVATDLLVGHGYRGVSFGDIAEALDTTRANIHYHFGNKTTLVDEVLDDYVTSTLDRFRAVWDDPHTSIADKVKATIAFNRERYERFNKSSDNGRPWSLIARLRADADALTPKGIATLRRFARELAGFVTNGIESGIRRGELVKNAPIRDIVIQLVSIANSAGPITQDAGSFQRLEELYTAFLYTVQAAYGRQKMTPADMKSKNRNVGV